MLAPAARVIELGADFALTRFRHRVRFNRHAHDVEMYLESMIDLTVHFADFVATFRAGDTIHTESSHKYSLAVLDRLLDDCSFRAAALWIDAAWQFASSLGVAV